MDKPLSDSRFNDSDALDDASQSPEQWLEKYVTQHGIRYDYKTDSLRVGSEVVEEPLALARLRLFAHEEGSKEVRPHIRDALMVWRHNQAKMSLDNLVEVIKFTPINDDPIATWVKSVTGRESPLDSAVVRHFIWQVKRKLGGLPVEHHLMPILFGRTGGGKSVAVSKLIEPLRMVAIQSDMSVFEDQFSRRLFTRNFILFFDELQGSLSVDINRMKQIITSPAVEWRTMRSERVHSGAQNCTFIGCTNDRVSDRIKDPTSARRFWEIKCADQLNWTTINEVDYLAVWRSVNEQGPCPLAPYTDEIRRIQEAEIRTKDLIEDWLCTTCAPCTFSESTLTTSELYANFRDWCMFQNIKAFPQLQKFSRDLSLQLERVGYSVECKKTNRGTSWSLKFDPSAAEAVSAISSVKAS